MIDTVKHQYKELQYNASPSKLIKSLWVHVKSRRNHTKRIPTSNLARLLKVVYIGVRLYLVRILGVDIHRTSALGVYTFGKCPCYHAPPVILVEVPR